MHKGIQNVDLLMLRNEAQLIFSKKGQGSMNLET